MPAIAALTINDGQGTPVAHTFSPVTTNGAKAEWADRSPATPAGYRKLHHEVVAPNGSRTAYGINLGVYNPVESVVNGSTVVVRSGSAKVNINFAPDMTLQERKDTVAYLVNYLQSATVKSSIENIETFY